MATCASVVNITVQLHKSCDSLCSCCAFMFCPRIAFLWMLWMHLDSCLNLERFYARAWKSIHTHTHIHICKHTQRREIVEGTHTHTNRNEPDSTPLLRLSAVRCCRQRSGHVRALCNWRAYWWAAYGAVNILICLHILYVHMCAGCIAERITWALDVLDGFKSRATWFTLLW